MTADTVGRWPAGPDRATSDRVQDDAATRLPLRGPPIAALGPFRGVPQHLCDGVFINASRFQVRADLVPKAVCRDSRETRSPPNVREVVADPFRFPAHLDLLPRTESDAQVKPAGLLASIRILRRGCPFVAVTLAPGISPDPALDTPHCHAALDLGWPASGRPHQGDERPLRHGR